MKDEPVPHEHRVAYALREALPTRRHGEMLFDMVAETLGAAARIESTPDGNHRALYRLDGSDPRWVIPWPILTLSRNARQTIHLDIPGLKLAPPLPPRPGKAPNLRGLGPGFIQLQDGADYVQVAYADDGRWFEQSRGGAASALEGVLPVIAAGSGPVVERLAEYMVALDAARNGPLRVFFPQPDTWTAWAAWYRAMPSLRTAVARGTLPPDARWMVVDPVDGTAIATGATRDEALFAWRAEVDRVRPGSVLPPRPETPTFEPPGEPELPPPEGAHKPKGPIRIEIRIGGGDDPVLPPPVPKPPPPELVPAAVIPIPEFPPAPHPFGAWRRFLDKGGATVLAALREDPAGWTLIGSRVLEVLGAPDAESAMDEAERAYYARPRNEIRMGPAPRGGTPWTARLFRLLDEATGLRCEPSTDRALHLADRSVPILDGDDLAFGGVRLRRERA